MLPLNWFEHQLQTPGSSKSRGVAIALSKGMQVHDVQCLKDPWDRFLFLKCKLDEWQFTLGTIYAPNTGQLDFLHDTLDRLANFQDGDLILGGGGNLAAHPVLDGSVHKKGALRSDKQKRQDGLGKLLEAHALVDIWRSLYPLARQYTFYPQKYQTHSRINYLLCSKSSFNFCTCNFCIGSKLVSDHGWVTCNFSLRSSDVRGWNWHLNRALIKDELYKPAIEGEIKNFFFINSDYGVATPTVWDAFKATLRGHLISLATACKKERERITVEIKERIGSLEAKHVRFGRQQTLRKLQIAKKKLELVKTAAIQQNLLFLKQKFVTRPPQYMK